MVQDGRFVSVLRIQTSASSCCPLASTSSSSRPFREGGQMSSDTNESPVTKLMNERRRPSVPEAAVGTERVDIELRGGSNGPFVCRKKRWEWSVDEPPERGGTDT